MVKRAGFSWTDEMVDRVRELATDYSAAVVARMISDEFHPVTRNAVLGIGHRKGIAFNAENTARRRRPPVRVAKSAGRGKPPRPSEADKQFKFGQRPLSRAELKEQKCLAEANRLTDVRSKPGDPAPVDPPMLLKDHRAGQCLWVHGDPKEGSYRLCGHAIVPGTPYCPAHKARTTVKAYVRLRDR